MLRHERVVSNHNRALLVTRTFAEQVNDFTGELFIQRAGRLITEQQRWFPNERTSNSHTLLFTAGESGDGCIRSVAQPQQGESVRNPLCSFSFGHATVDERQLNVAVHILMLDEVERLEDETDAVQARFSSLCRVEGCGVCTVQQVAAGGGRAEQTEDVQQG